MRMPKAVFARGMFRAYRPTKVGSAYIAGQAMAQLLAATLEAENTEDYMAIWLTQGQDDPAYGQKVAEMRANLSACDGEVLAAQRDYRLQFLNS